MNRSHRNLPSRVALVALAFAAISALPAAAATIRVTVLDSRGAPVSRARVALVDGSPGQPPAVAESDRDGLAIFRDISWGKFRITLDPTETAFVRPEDNPLAPPGTVEVLEKGATLERTLVVYRGIPLHLRFHVDGATLRYATRAIFEDRVSGRRLTRPISQGEELRLQLFPGLFRVSLEPPPGLLLDRVIVDGTAVEGAAVDLDVQEISPAAFLTWDYSARARIRGGVYFEREPFAMEVRARLVAPGPWVAAFEQRGGSSVDEVMAPVDTATGLFEMHVPDGQWLVAPAGEQLASADPTERQIVVGPGDEVRVDFDVRGPLPRAATLEWIVVGPAGDPVEDARLEVWPSLPQDRGDEPVAAGRSDAEGRVSLRGLPAGNWLVAAAHLDHTEGRMELAGYDPIADHGDIRTLRLGPGGRIEVRLQNPQVTAGDEIWLGVLAREASGLVTSPDLVEARGVRKARFDLDGFAAVGGLDAGPHEVAAIGGATFVQLLDGERWREGWKLDLAAGELRRLTAKATAAGVVTGSLHCAGGEPLPTRIDLRVVPGDAVASRSLDETWRDDRAAAPHESFGEASLDPAAVPLPGSLDKASQGDAAAGPPGSLATAMQVDAAAALPRAFGEAWQDGAVPAAGSPRETWQDDAVVALDRAGLGGDRHDMFRAGPLEPGSYAAAFRPAEFDRWTWAFGTENGAEAGTFDVAEGRGTDLGAIAIDCAPTIRVRIEVADGGAVPDLRDLTAQGGQVEVSGRVVGTGGEIREARPARVEARPGTLVLHGLAEGTADLSVRFGHRYFLPEFWLDLPAQGELVRGRSLQVVGKLPAAGGAIAIRALGAAAARLSGQEGTEGSVGGEGPKPGEGSVGAAGGEGNVGSVGGGAQSGGRFERAGSFDGERLIFGNLPRGAYRVTLCADHDCAQVLATFEGVEVLPLVTRDLAWGASNRPNPPPTHPARLLASKKS